jgi:hypothetical protein
VLLKISNCLAAVTGHDEMVEFWICDVASGPGKLGASCHLQVVIWACRGWFDMYQLWEGSAVWMVIVVEQKVCRILRGQDWSLPPHLYNKMMR